VSATGGGANVVLSGVNNLAIANTISAAGS